MTAVDELPRMWAEAWRLADGAPGAHRPAVPRLPSGDAQHGGLTAAEKRAERECDE